MKFLLSLLITYFVSIHFVTAETFIFIGSYNYDKNKEGIFVYQLDTLTGALTKVTAAKDVLNPSYFTLSQNGQFYFRVQIPELLAMAASAVINLMPFQKHYRLLIHKKPVEKIPFMPH
jgi:hypothetical protein